MKDKRAKWFKWFGAVAGFSLLLFSCLSTTIKETVELEYYIAPLKDLRTSTRANFRDTYNAKSKFPLMLAADRLPQIDGAFGEWAGVPGIQTQLDVLGSAYNLEDAHATMAALTDGSFVWFFVQVRDDLVEDNRRSEAYLGDSLDIFFSFRPSTLRRELGSEERQIRIIPRRNPEAYNAVVTLGGKEYRHIVAHRLVYDDSGFRIEFRVPVLLLGERQPNLRPGRKLRLSLQYNDSDGNGRDRILHWVNPEDSSWRDFSAWGHGEVVAADKNTNANAEVVTADKNTRNAENTKESKPGKPEKNNKEQTGGLQ